MLPCRLSANTNQKQAMPAGPPLALAGECLLFGLLSGAALYPELVPSPEGYQPGARAASPSVGIALPALPLALCQQAAHCHRPLRRHCT